MKRLTAKRNEVDRKSNYTTDINNVCVDELDNGYKFIAGKVIEKLGALEDIEEELGIDLIVLFKALKNGIWFYRGKKKVYTSWCIAVNGNGDGGNRKTTFWLSYKVNGFDFPDYYEKLDFKDYGITWALTKEELE